MGYILALKFSGDSLHLVVEYFVLEGRDLFASLLELEAKKYVLSSPYSAIQDDYLHHVELGFEQMLADMWDMAFYCHKKM